MGTVACRQVFHRMVEYDELVEHDQVCVLCVVQTPADHDLYLACSHVVKSSPLISSLYGTYCGVQLVVTMLMRLDLLSLLGSKGTRISVTRYPTCRCNAT